MIYLVIAVIFLFIISRPFTVSVAVEIDTDKKRGEVKIKLSFITLFKKRFDPRGVISAIESEKSDKEKSDDKPESSYPSGATIEFIKQTLSRIRVRELCLNVRLGVGDAAVSAVLIGLVCIIYGQICSFLCYDGDGEITPDYNSETVIGDFSGIFSLCIADIIYAGFAALAANLKTKSAKSRKKYANVIAE